MDPARKRKVRLFVALGAAVFLAAALVYTSFSASTEASKPSQIEPGRSYELTGKVVQDSVSREGDGLRFRIERGTFVAERDSLVTKCPSKFTKEEGQPS